MADQAINALPTKDTPESTDQLLLIGDAEEKIIDYDKLADAILNKLTSKKFEMDTGTQTIMEAIASLNGKHAKKIKKTVTTSTTNTLAYTGAEITIKKNQVAILGFANTWKETPPVAMQITNSKTENSISTMVSPEITSYPNKCNIVIAPINDTTLYVWTKHSSEKRLGSVSIEGVIFDL